MLVCWPQARGHRVFVAGADVRAEWNQRVQLHKRSQDLDLGDVMPRAIRFCLESGPAPRGSA